MKHMKKFAFLMILAVGLSACSLFNVDVDSEISGVLDAYVPEAMAKAADDWHPLVATKEIDARENDDVQEYADNIEDIVVNEITATVTGVSHEGIILSADTDFYLTYGSKTVTWSKGVEWPIYEGATFTFDNLGSSYDDASKIILQAAKTDGESIITIGVDGESSKDGINVKMKIVFGTTFTANIF